MQYLKYDWWWAPVITAIDDAIVPLDDIITVIDFWIRVTPQHLDRHMTTRDVHTSSGHVM